MQNNVYAKGVYLGTACPWPLQDSGVGLLIDMFGAPCDQWEAFTKELRSLGTELHLAVEVSFSTRIKLH